MLLDPFRLAGSAGFQTAAFDAERDVPLVARWETAGADAMLVIDGEFLLRPELRDLWNVSVLLTDAPQNAVYLADADPAAHATYLVDDAVPEAPLFVAR